MCIFSYHFFGTYDHQFQLSVFEDGTVEKTVHTYLSNHRYTGHVSQNSLMELQHQIELLSCSRHVVTVTHMNEYLYFSELVIPGKQIQMSWQGDVPSLPVELKQLLYLIDQIELTRQRGAA